MSASSHGPKVYLLLIMLLAIFVVSLDTFDVVDLQLISSPITTQSTSSVAQGNDGYAKIGFFRPLSQYVPSDAVYPRAFPRWPKNRQIPCFEPPDSVFFDPDKDHNHDRMRDGKMDRGFMYVKMRKCASTSLASVSMRMARNHKDMLPINNGDREHSTMSEYVWNARDMARRGDPIAPEYFNDTIFCDQNWRHGAANQFNNRVKQESLLWTVLREPTSRYVSNYFFRDVYAVSVPASDEKFMLHRLVSGPLYYVEELSLDELPPYLSTELDFENPVPRQYEAEVTQISNKIMNEYDFIGVTERLDESLVCLMMIAHLNMADIMFLSSKISGMKRTDRNDGNECIGKSFISPFMKEYFANETWKDYIHHDLALYKAVNRSLDLTIDALGREEVEANLAVYKRAQALAKERCSAQAGVVEDEECVAENITVAKKKEITIGHDPIKHKRGQMENGCITGDVGCGFECLDEVADELGLW